MKHHSSNDWFRCQCKHEGKKADLRTIDDYRNGKARAFVVCPKCGRDNWKTINKANQTTKQIKDP